MTTRHNKSKERRLIFAQFALLAAQIMRQALRAYSLERQSMEQKITSLEAALEPQVDKESVFNFFGLCVLVPSQQLH